MRDILKYNHFFIICIIFIFTGCNLTSTSTTSNSNTIKGYLIDSKVAGIQYECSNDNISGITNINGEFEFSQNCNTLSFKIGNTILASIAVKDIPRDNKLFITDLVGVHRSNSNTIKVINILRLLQTLDSDNNSHNGIDINDSIKNNITNFYIHEVKDIVLEQELINILDDANYYTSLISKTKALVHFEQTLRDNNINIDTVPPFRPELDLRLFTLDSGKILVKIENNITTIAVPSDTINIKFYGEEDTFVQLNNNELNITITKQILKHSFIENFELNTNHTPSTFKDYNITLRDNTNKTSLPLILHILKDTNPPEFDISLNSELNVTIPNRSIVDINVTDLDVLSANSDANGLVVYEITSSNKDLFDINKTGFLKFKEDCVVGDYNLSIKITDFAGHSPQDKILTIHCIN